MVLLNLTMELINKQTKKKIRIFDERLLFIQTYSILFICVDSPSTWLCQSLHY